jgi:hypothetical protein
MDRSSQRLRKAWHPRNGREILELVRRDRCESGSRGHRFARRLRAGRVPSLERLRGRASRELGETESQDSKRRAETVSHRAREIVSGPTRGAYDNDF